MICWNSGVGLPGGLIDWGKEEQRGLSGSVATAEGCRPEPSCSKWKGSMTCSLGAGGGRQLRGGQQPFCSSSQGGEHPVGLSPPHPPSVSRQPWASGSQSGACSGAAPAPERVSGIQEDPHQKGTEMQGQPWPLSVVQCLLLSPGLGFQVVIVKLVSHKVI